MDSESQLELLATDIRRQPQLIGDAIPWCRTIAAETAHHLRGRPSRIYLVGCGDSLDAGIAVRSAWERLLGIPTEPVPALMFSRYLVDTAPPDALVVALSQSGKVSRVTECAHVAVNRGLEVVAITANSASPLAQESGTSVIVTDFPKLGVIPGTSSYTFNMTLLFELGAALAEAWMGGGEFVQELRKGIDALPSLLAASLSGVWEVARSRRGGNGGSPERAPAPGNRPEPGERTVHGPEAVRDAATRRDATGDRGVRPRSVLDGRRGDPDHPVRPSGSRSRTRVRDPHLAPAPRIAGGRGHRAGYARRPGNLAVRGVGGPAGTHERAAVRSFRPRSTRTSWPGSWAGRSTASPMPSTGRTATR